MARARIIKPTFFQNEDVAELPVVDRLLFIGLWMLADREGRLEDRPKRIKAQLFPYDDLDVDTSLNRMRDARLIERYVDATQPTIAVVNFRYWVGPESLSDRFKEITVSQWRVLRQAIFDRDGRACRYCGATDRPLSIDHVVPLIRGGGYEPENLVVACQNCNSRKGSKLIEEWVR